MFYITITNIIAVITTVATYRSYDMTYYLSLVHGGRVGGELIGQLTTFQINSTTLTILYATCGAYPHKQPHRQDDMRRSAARPLCPCRT